MASDREWKRDYKEWLRENYETFLQYLDPRRTVTALRSVDPEGLDPLDLENIFQKHTTPREQTEALLNILPTRGPEFCEAFRRVVQITNDRLAGTVAPVRYRILWVAPSTRHAALVAHTLQKYAKASFLPAQERAGYLVRKGTVFGENDTQVSLVFPTKSGSISVLLGEAVEKNVNFALLTGISEPLAPPTDHTPTTPCADRILLVTEASSPAHSHPLRCPAAQRVHLIQRQLQERLRRVVWVCAPLRERYRHQTLCAAQAGLLARLWVELQCVGRGEESTWLSAVGWEREGVKSEKGDCEGVKGEREGAAGEGTDSVKVESEGVKGGEGEGVIGEENRALLGRLLPDWPTGELARWLLKERLWYTDSTSPLGLSPTEQILKAAQREQDARQFSRPPDTELHSEPIFGGVSPPGGLGVASDPDTFLFYQSCSRRLGESGFWMACRYLKSTNNGEGLGEFLAVAVAMEVIQLLRTHH